MLILASPTQIRFVFGRDDSLRGLEYLLPEAFKPADLLGADNNVPLLLQRQHHVLRLSKPSADKVLARKDDAVFQQAVHEALSHASGSYAPYTECPSGVALITEDVRVFGGCYIESNAYNPGLGPFQAAIVAAVKAGVEDYGKIKEVVLVERSGDKVKHASNIQVLLKTIAKERGGSAAPLTRLIVSRLPSPQLPPAMDGPSRGAAQA